VAPPLGVFAMPQANRCSRIYYAGARADFVQGL